jgi:iron complex transport system substrate-binding protein
MNSIRTRAAALAGAAAVALALAGCGTTEEAADTEEAASGESITVTDARGTEVTLDGPATRVVGTEWNVVENLVTLGVMPVGVADTAGYSEYVSAGGPLDDSVTDIGTRGEPSIDTVASLGADLILATDDLPESAVAQLEELAPVFVVTSADASRQIDQMKENLELVAELTGTTDEAERVIGEYDAAVADGAAALAEAGLDGSRVAFADGALADGTVSFRPFVAGSLLADVNAELGLVSPWEVEGDPAYGLGATDIEGMTELDADALVYIAPDDLEEELSGNEVWKSLPFVESGDVHRLTDPIWMFGGPGSMTQYADAVVATLTA